MNLNVNYMGLQLRNPIVIASSPFTASLEPVKKAESAGAGAVVLKSVFEEQIKGEAAFLDVFNDYPEAADYLNNYIGQDYLDKHLKFISQLKNEVGIPVIASINCSSDGTWADYARSMEAAGADALELNIYLMPTGADITSQQVEEGYLSVLRSVVERVSIPVSVKLNMRFTNILNICSRIYNRGGRAVVMFNRMFEPDFDIDEIKLTHPSGALSSPSELRNSLRTVGLCAPQITELDISVSTGVYTGEDVVKCILAGAKSVQLCSAISKSGFGIIGRMTDYLSCWMDRHTFSQVEDFRGLLSRNRSSDEDLYQRVQYMRFFPSK
ncbi:MAG: dihydroorotate dehydrogenase-like protein [Rikenellaceae bacterium]|nr:dihydroorotate dehydrogenase-like protein [Rikenellaceae bacterium]